eukprot:TRINITY_DN3696_c0_g1_i1.p1 TRINITY_DN3696_c0_g1~~TRINITY_DN3696_c0_g1_i1.p1  ORF type:complete len:277 (-),score=47.97 TRINITY_DN3696_c0_g1_i1:127-873(-)
MSAFGLADGVGGWSSRGVDAGLFSRALMRRSVESIRQQSEGMRKPDLPRTASEAFEDVRSQQIRGSSTLMLGQLQQDLFTCLNLGDCGLLVLRPTTILPKYHGGTVKTTMRRLYRSSSMLHRPNLPFQLSSEDSDLSALASYDLVTLKLEKGDILIAGTDGLFDNVGDRELTSMVLAHYQRRTAGDAKATSSSSSVELCEQLLTRAADSARAPIEYGNGGKLDDIAIIVAEAAEWTPSVSGATIQNFE